MITGNLGRFILIFSGVMIFVMVGIVTLARAGGDSEAYFVLYHSTYSQGRGVYRINPDGSGRTQIVSPARRSRWARWLSTNAAESISPDGEWIAFHSEHTGNYNLYLRRADGSDVRSLLVAPETDAFPQWSPDGKRILFVRYVTIESVAISDIGVEGGEPRQLTLARFPFADDARYSPDGQWIAFSSGFEGVYSIYRIPADGSDQGNEVVRLTAQGASNHSPSWSPDGRWIAFVSDRDGNAEIYRMRADGSDVQRLTENTVSDQMPVWSPNYARDWQPGMAVVVGVGMVGIGIGLKKIAERCKGKIEPPRWVNVQVLKTRSEMNK